MMFRFKSEVIMLLPVLLLLKLLSYNHNILHSYSNNNNHYYVHGYCFVPTWVRIMDTTTFKQSKNTHNNNNNKMDSIGSRYDYYYYKRKTNSRSQNLLYMASSKLYDIESIAQSTSEFREKFAFIDDDDNYNNNQNNSSDDDYKNDEDSTHENGDNDENQIQNESTIDSNQKQRKSTPMHNIETIKGGNGGYNRGGVGGGVGLHLPYESTIQVLRTFHKQHGHLVIPRRYTIPSSSSSSSLANVYPREWHNIDIASTVYNMKWWSKHVRSNPDRVKELNSLGFVWERLQSEWNLVLEALVVYKSIHGHVKVPASFVVPYGNEIQNNSKLDDDNNMIIYDNDDNSDDGTSIWPKGTWGIPLGNCVHRIRTRGDFLRNDELAFSRRRQLDGLGFIWDVNEDAFEKFFHALKIFAKLEEKVQFMQSQQYATSNGKSGEKQKRRVQYQRTKALRIPQRFVVPATKMLEDGTPNPWPKQLWNYPLGIKCAAIKHKELYVKNNPERQRALQEIGFQMSGNATIGWLNIVWASAIYSKIHGKGTLDVPVNFVVPSAPLSTDDCSIDKDSNSYDSDDDEWPWPVQLWGFPLGQRLKDVRLKGAHLKDMESAIARRAQLDALGFVWDPKRGRRKRSLGDGGVKCSDD